MAALHFVENEILSNLIFLLTHRGAHAKGESVKAFIQKQFMNAETTLEPDISPSTPAELDPRKRRAS